LNRDLLRRVIDATLEAVPELCPLIAVKTQAAYEIHIWSYFREFFTGKIDAFSFINQMAGDIENQFTRAWNEGARSVNVEPVDMEQDDLDELASKIKTEQDYLDGVAGDIEAFIAEGNHTDAEFNERFKSRAMTWANAYARTVTDAQIWFGKKEKLEWIEGDTKDKCNTCVRLNGIVAWAKEWSQAGIKPQSQDLECQGFNCQCQLSPTDKRRTADALGKIMDIMVGANI
jgi:hypothetical protein